MFLEITPKAEAKIRPRLTDQTKIVLDFDDGVGPFSNAATCTMDESFNLVLCTDEKLTHDFDQQIDSTLGPVYIKGYAAVQLDDNMTLDVDKYLRYALRGGSGVLDPNVILRDEQIA